MSAHLDYLIPGCITAADAERSMRRTPANDLHQRALYVPYALTTQAALEDTRLGTARAVIKIAMLDIRQGRRTGDEDLTLAKVEQHLAELQTLIGGEF